MDKLQKELTAEKELNQILTRFICHNLINPLTVIKNYLILMENNRIPAEEIPSILKRIEHSNQSAITIIKQIREASFIRKKAETLTLRDVLVDEAVKLTLETMQAAAQERNIELTFESYLSSGAKVWAHGEGLVDHVLRNVISYSIKHSFEGSLLKIISFETSDHIEFELRFGNSGLELDPKEGFELNTAKFYINRFGGELSLETMECLTVISIQLPKSQIKDAFLLPRHEVVSEFLH